MYLPQAPPTVPLCPRRDTGEGKPPARWLPQASSCPCTTRSSSRVHPLPALFGLSRLFPSDSSCPFPSPRPWYLNHWEASLKKASVFPDPRFPRPAGSRALHRRRPPLCPAWLEGPAASCRTSEASSPIMGFALDIQTVVSHPKMNPVSPLGPLLPAALPSSSLPPL